MSICYNKMFNKFLIFSFIFLLLSFACNSVFVSASETRKSQPKIEQKTNEIQVQQKEIIDHLEKLENKMVSKVD